MDADRKTRKNVDYFVLKNVRAVIGKHKPDYPGASHRVSPLGF